MRNAPIAMIDSGVGGLSVLREVRQWLPAESVIYLSDQAHIPYGPRTRAELREYVVAMAHYLRSIGCKMLVIACNAGSAAALHHVRQEFPEWPIVGMEPAIKPAAERTQTGVIGVITTKATFQGELFASVVDRFAQHVRVETQVCPDFVTLVEGGVSDADAAREAAARYLRPLKEAGIDQLVIGCTHFPFLEPYLREYLGPGVQIVDPAPAVARQVERVLAGRGLLNTATGDEGGSAAYYLTTGDPTRFRAVLHQLLGVSAPVSHARWAEGRLEPPVTAP